MMYGLSDEVIERIRGVFARYPQVTRVVLYGSRAKGNFRAGSDIDLTIEGSGVTLSMMLKIENELEDLLLPYKIDLSLLNQIEDPDLKDHIARVGMVFYDHALSSNHDGR